MLIPSGSARYDYEPEEARRHSPARQNRLSVWLNGVVSDDCAELSPGIYRGVLAGKKKQDILSLWRAAFSGDGSWLSCSFPGFHVRFLEDLKVVTCVVVTLSGSCFHTVGR